MSKKFCLIFTFLLLLVAVSSYSQEVITDEASGVKITIPAEWKYTPSEKTLTINSPDGEFAVVLTVMESGEIDKAIKALEKDLETEFTDLDVKDPKESETNGMPTVTIYGSGKTKEGVAIVFVYSLVVTPKAKILEIAVVGTPDSITKYEKEIQLIDNSLQPIQEVK